MFCLCASSSKARAIFSFFGIRLSFGRDNLRVSLPAVRVGRLGLSQKFPGNLGKEKVNQCPNSVPVHFLVSFGKCGEQNLSHHNPLGADWTGMGRGIALGSILLPQLWLSSQKCRVSPVQASNMELLLEQNSSKHFLELRNIGNCPCAFVSLTNGVCSE